MGNILGDNATIEWEPTQDYSQCIIFLDSIKNKYNLYNTPIMDIENNSYFTHYTYSVYSYPLWYPRQLFYRNSLQKFCEEAREFFNEKNIKYRIYKKFF